MKNKPSKNDLSKKIDGVVAQAKIKKQDIQNVEKNLQYTIDFGQVTLHLVQYFDQSEINNQYQFWEEAGNQIESISPLSNSLFSSTDFIAGTASTSSASAIGFVTQNHQQLSESSDFLDVWRDYTNVVTNRSVFDNIRYNLHELHLDKGSSGELSPLELFNTAIDAYDSPVSDKSPAITSLLPIRESISSAIKQLLKFRPNQEKTGQSDINKIISIGNQLKKDITTSAMVSKWADEWHKINDEVLSDSKETPITRSEWIAKLFRVANFYYGFLSGLDPSKLKKRKI